VNPWVGWLLAAAALGAGWRGWGWPGIGLGLSAIVFWLLMQWTVAMRVMRRAAQAPLGTVASAVMLNARLKKRMPMLDIVRTAGSLGSKLRDSPETWAWTDPGGASVELEVEAGRLVRWNLVRPHAT